MKDSQGNEIYGDDWTAYLFASAVTAINNGWSGNEYVQRVLLDQADGSDSGGDFSFCPVVAKAFYEAALEVAVNHARDRWYGQPYMTRYVIGFREPSKP